MPGKSCITQLVNVLDRELDRGNQIDVLYLDMSKAFDKVSHAKLLHRLRQFGFGGNILKWFRSYLNNRHQRTTILGATSKSLPVASGVPQGSILVPLLFLLYEDHLSNAVRASNIATFADDTKIFRTISSNSDAVALQTDLTNFEESSKNVNLILNASKCKVLRVTRKHNKIIYPYKLNETILTSTECKRDLGVLTSSDLTWSKHIDHQYSQQDPGIRAKINTRHKEHHGPSHTLFISGSRPVVLWLPNLGTTNYHRNPTGRTAPKTGN